MIDVHSHILPSIDDGADSFETSLEMLKIAEHDGIAKIIATPHFCPGYYETDYSKVLFEIERLNKESINRGINIEILPGQEVFLTKNLLDYYREGMAKTLNGSRYMLVELPFDYMPDYALDVIYELMLLNIVPIIAHPERYMYIIKKPSTINEFIAEGCLFQINSWSITGLFGKDVQRTAELLIRHNICHFIGSDAHSNKKRSPKLKKSFDIIKGINESIVTSLTKNVDILINNQDIFQKCKKIKERNSILIFFK